MLDIKRSANASFSGTREQVNKLVTAQPATAVARPQEKTSTGLNLNWKYDSQKHGSRDLRLDVLRGFCIIVMMIDHIGVFGPDSWLYYITAKGEFFLSAAEGFVFISGLVMGMVYFRLISKEGLGKAMPKVIGRIVKLYWLAVGLTLFFVALAKFTDLNLWADRSWLQTNDWGQIIVGALTLHLAFHGSSIIVMYVILLSLAPIAFYMMNNGKTLHLIGISAAVWAANCFYPDQFSIPFASNFPIASWQALFVGGLAIGWHRNKLATLLNERWQKIYAVSIAVGAVLMLGVYIAHKNGTLDDVLPFLNADWLWTDFMDKGKLPLARMLMVALYIQAFYLLLTWAWKPLNAALGWFLLPIGELALYSYTMHLVLIVVVYNIPGFRELPYLLYGFAVLGALGGLYVAAKTHFLGKLIPS